MPEQCPACRRYLPCTCCTCKRTRTGRVLDRDCPVPSHQLALTPVEMGTIIGVQMTEIMAAKRRNEGHY